MYALKILFSILFTIIFILLLSVFNFLGFQYQILAFITFLIFVIISITNLRFAVYIWIALSGTLNTSLIEMKGGHIYLGYPLLVTLIIVWLVSLLKKRENRVIVKNITIPVLVFSILVICSTIFGIFYRDYDINSIHNSSIMKIYSSTFYILSLSTILLVCSQIKSRTDIKILSIVLLSSSIILIIDKIMIKSDVVPTRFDVGSFVFSAPLAISFAIHGKFNPWKLCLFIIPFYPWKASILELLYPGTAQLIVRWVYVSMSALYMLFFKSRKIFLWVAMILITVTVLNAEKVVEIQERTEAEGANARYHEWTNALGLFTYWPLGIGPGNYYDYSATYKRSGLLELTTPHSQYVQLIAETGVATLMVFLWLSYSILKIGISLYNTLADPFLKAFVLGATAAFFSQLLAAGLGDHMLPAYHNAGYARFGTTVYTWVCAGAIVAVHQFSRHDRHTAYGEN